jgi:hypothetical protein
MIRPGAFAVWCCVFSLLANSTGGARLAFAGKEGGESSTTARTPSDERVSSACNPWLVFIAGTLAVELGVWLYNWATTPGAKKVQEKANAVREKMGRTVKHHDGKPQNDIFTDKAELYGELDSLLEDASAARAGCNGAEKLELDQLIQKLQAKMEELRKLEEDQCY